MLYALFDQMSKTIIDATVLVSLLISLVSITIALIASTTSRRLKRRYKTLLRGKDGANLEQMLLENHEEVGRVADRLSDIEHVLQEHEQRIAKKVSTPRIVRYNAFAEAGNDLSFSVALVDEDGNGTVISSIYGREESRVYAKPLTKRSSTYTLTPEESSIVLGEVPSVTKIQQKAR